MFVLNDDMSIYATRGDTVFFTVGATDGSGAKYKFKPDDVVRFKAFEKKACENVVAQKDFVITEETEEVNILLTEDDTRFGKIISKPRDYWYEIELNPFTNPQTIIGYDDDGPKVFRLYPESKNIVKDISEEDFYADAELSVTSTNPVQNQAVTRAVANLSKYIDDGLKGVKESVLSEEEALRIKGELRVLDSDVASLKSDFNEHTHTASDVGAVPSSKLETNFVKITHEKTTTDGDERVISCYYLKDTLYWRIDVLRTGAQYRLIDNGEVIVNYTAKPSSDYLPLAGGTLSGAIRFKLNDGTIYYGLPNSESEVRLIHYNNRAYTRVYKDNNNYAEIVHGLGEAPTWSGRNNSNTFNHSLFGSHNKPSGSYTGNGSATGRSIATGGIGNACMINSSKGTVILGYHGGLSALGYRAGEYNFRDGNIGIASSHEVINASGETYTYQVL